MPKYNTKYLTLEKSLNYKKERKKRESFHSIFAINLRSSLHEVEATRREIEN